MNVTRSFVMRRALEDDQLLGFALADELVHKPMLVVDAAAPASVHVPKLLRLADAGVPVALDVLDEQVDAFEDFLVLQLPSGIFVPCARREVYIHDRTLVQASINSCLFASPRSNDSIDSRRTRWFASDQKGSGFFVTTSIRVDGRLKICQSKLRKSISQSSEKLSVRLTGLE